MTNDFAPPADLADRVSCVWRRRGALPATLPEPAVDLLVFADGSLWLAGPETVARTGNLPQPLTGIRLRPGTCASVLGIAADEVPLNGMRRLDSLLRLGDRSVRSNGWYSPFYAVANLVSARLWEAHGNVPRALAAVRRRRYRDNMFYEATYLREEARLAALAGDCTGASRAARAYLALRRDLAHARLAEGPGPPAAGAGAACGS